jgi:SMC interacting uncharacterized protein involved in chromosome segregation
MKSFKEHTLSEQSKHEITVGGYTTNHFFMCGSAQKIMKQNADKEGAEELTKLQDDFFKLEKEVMDSGEPTQQQIGIAHDLYHKIDNLAKARKIEMPYMKDHLNSILKGDPKPGFGRTDVKEALTISQRRDRARKMKRLAPKIARAKQRAAKKMATPEKLRTRANRKARQLLAKKLIKGRDISALSFAEKEKLEKRLDKLKPKISKIAKKIFPKVKMAEKERLAKYRASQQEK